MDCIFTIELLDLSFGDVHRSHDNLKAGDAASLSSMEVDDEVVAAEGSRWSRCIENGRRGVSRFG